jgi:Ser/Thr protein kinase RdoA (MazF antagonist)
VSETPATQRSTALAPGFRHVRDQAEACARAALRLHGAHPAASLELLAVSENVTFLVSDPEAGLSVLRVHRPGYHTEPEILSELAWMDALRAEAGVRTPRVLPAPGGRRVVMAGGEAGPRHCVRLEFLPGAEPGPAPGREPGAPPAGRHFEELGEITARMHRHARAWPRPPWFTRFHWDEAAAFGNRARWGRWQHGAGAGPAERHVLGRLEQVLRARLAAFGRGPERYGLVHADTRPANLLVHGGAVSVIDFDDCGFSWYLYDLGAAVSFFEHSPDVPGLVASWLAGYRRAGRLSAGDEAEIWTFILLRRLLLVAWIASHRDAAAAAGLGAGYTRDSCDLAESYLSTYGRRS